MIDAYGSAFDQHSVDYAQTWGEDPIARLMRDEVFCSMKTGLNRPSKVLDLGCGIGLDSAWLVSQGHSVLAVDHSAECWRKRSSGFRNYRWFTPGPRTPWTPSKWMRLTQS